MKNIIHAFIRFLHHIYDSYLLQLQACYCWSLHKTRRRSGKWIKIYATTPKARPFFHTSILIYELNEMTITTTKRIGLDSNGEMKSTISLIHTYVYHFTRTHTHTNWTTGKRKSNTSIILYYSNVFVNRQASLCFFIYFSFVYLKFHARSVRMRWTTYTYMCLCLSNCLLIEIWHKSTNDSIYI